MYQTKTLSLSLYIIHFFPPVRGKKVEYIYCWISETHKKVDTKISIIHYYEIWADWAEFMNYALLLYFHTLSVGYRSYLCNWQHCEIFFPWGEKRWILPNRVISILLPNIFGKTTVSWQSTRLTFDVFW